MALHPEKRVTPAWAAVLGILASVLIPFGALAFTTTPEMGLKVPGVGDTDYATSISDSFTLIDEHDHTAGKGTTLGTNAVPTAAIQASAVTSAKILDGTIATADLADASVTPAKRAALGQQVSSSSSTFFTTSTSFADVTNLSVSITTTGRPVWVGLVADGSANPAHIGSGDPGAASPSAIFQILRDASAVAVFDFVGIGLTLFVPPSSVSHIDVPAAGTYTYKLQAKGPGSSIRAYAEYVKLIAFQL